MNDIKSTNDKTIIHEHPLSEAQRNFLLRQNNEIKIVRQSAQAKIDAIVESMNAFVDYAANEAGLPKPLKGWEVTPGFTHIKGEIENFKE